MGGSLAIGWAINNSPLFLVLYSNTKSLERAVDGLFIFIVTRNGGVEMRKPVDGG